MELWVSKTLEYWSAGGLLLIPMLLISFGIWACFFRSREQLRKTILNGRKLGQELDLCTTVQEAARIAEQHAQNGGGIGTLIDRAIRDVSSGAGPMEAMQIRMAEALRLMRRDFVIMAACTAIAPLLGLLGTVMGMIDTFDAVSLISGDTGSRVAAGISRALITTQFGLVVALPGVFGMARLQRMISYIEILMAECRAQVVTLLEEAPKKEAL